MTRRDLVPLGFLTALITLLFVDVLAGFNALYLRDISHYFYPAKHTLREIVLGGEFPYWNPLIAAGQPMAANPEHEVFYPLTWLILLPSYHLGFRLLLLLHVYICAWTMYALLRSMRTSPAAAFFGALSFALGGLVLSLLTLMAQFFVFAWLPLTCLFTRHFLLERRPRDFALAALVLGLQMLIGEPTVIAQTGFLLGMYAIAICIRERSVRPLAWVAAISIAALAVGAVMVVPAVDHAADSVRARGFTFDVVTTWSMPAARLAELVFPNVLGHHTTDTPLYWGASLYGDRRTPFFLSVYPGLLLATMAIAGFFARVRGAGLTAAILGSAFLLALGHHTPLWQWLYDLGLARSLRYPEKFIMMGVFAVTVFGARVLDRVLEGDERVRRAALRAATGVAILAAVAALIAFTPLHTKIFTALWSPRPQTLTEMLARSRSAWVVAALFATLLALLLRNLPALSRRTWLALATLFVLLDLGLLIPEVAPRMPSEYFTEPPLLAQRLPKNRDQWRLMNVIEWQTRDVEFRAFNSGSDLYWIRRNALRPMMPARWGIRAVMEVDYDLTSLTPTADFVETVYWLAHGRKDWPDVVAPMANAWFLGSYDDPQRALARAGGDRRNVQPVRVVPLGKHPRYYFATEVVPIRNTEEFAEKLRHAKSTRGVAFTSADNNPSSAFGTFSPHEGRRALAARLPSNTGTVRSVRETANTARIDVETRGPAFLVMSVTPHKYWRVQVDGKPAEAIVTNVGFQGVVIPDAGRHTVEMRYRNPLIAIGGVVSVVAVLALAFVAITMRAL